jgi:hypothetical protein
MLLWDFRKRRMVVFTDVSGKPIGSIFKGPIGCPEMSVTNYHSTLCEIPKRAQISFIARRKPDITHGQVEIFG